MMVTAAASQTQDMGWIKRNLGESAAVTVTDVTSAYAVLAVMGPRARDLLAKVSPADFTNAAFPFGTMQDIEIGYAKAWALRLTYVGELGWSFMCRPNSQATCSMS